MKRNLLSVIILALLVVNLVLTSIMMVNVNSASQKTAELVTDIAQVLDLELSDGTGGAMTSNVPMEDIEVYKIAEQMTIPLKLGEDGQAHYCLVSVALSMDIKNEGYKAYGAGLSSKESLITAKIYDIIGSYTLEEAQANKDLMREDILKQVQAMFDSDFIFQVSFSDIIFQ
ncbi:flagellar basal body-associated FliL family protein [Lachnospiraceae bacterium JLR.KK008]